MARFLAWSVAVAVLVAACGTLQTWAPTPPPDRANLSSASDGERVLVRFRPGTPAAKIEALDRRVGATFLGEIPRLGVRVMVVPRGTAQAAIGAYGSDADVDFAEPDHVLRASLEPNDTYWSSQWGPQKVSAPAAWDVTTGSTMVKIAILDTGISSTHPDLSGKVVASQNFTRSRTAEDRNGHGTHVAGIAAALTNNAVGIAGMDWQARLMNVKVLGDDGSGFTSWVASGIVWAADNGAKVINLSLGGPSPSSTLQQAVDYAWGQGAVLACAAGNSGSTAPEYPAYYPNCIAVGATTQSDTRASFSNHGSWVDVGAPGVDILSTVPPRRYKSYGGTSMATPHVSGLAGLLWTRLTANSAVRSCVETTTDPISGAPFAAGRINAANAITCAAEARQ